MYFLVDLIQYNKLLAYEKNNYFWLFIIFVCLIFAFSLCRFNEMQQNSRNKICRLGFKKKSFIYIQKIETIT